jgi:hypothetical protein
MCNPDSFVFKQDGDQKRSWLARVFQSEIMPSSGLSVSDANIRKQLKTPLQDMPSFSDLPDEDIEALIAHLKTL